MTCKFRGSHLIVLLSVVGCLYRLMLLAYAVRQQAVAALVAGMIGLSLLKRGDISRDPIARAGSNKKTPALPLAESKGGRITLSLVWPTFERKHFPITEGVFKTVVARGRSAYNYL